MLRWIGRYLRGDDIFISYSRADGITYASGIANRLVDLGFSCHLDQWGTPAGASLPEPLLQALRNSALLVLIGTRGAANSENVRREVEEFSTTRRPIVPVVSTGFSASTEAIWWDSIQGLPLSEETEELFQAGNPSEQVVNRIAKTCTFRRKEQRQRRATACMLGIAAVFLLIAAGAGLAARAKGERASELGADAHLSKVVADFYSSRASLEKGNAARAKRETDQAKGEALQAAAESVRWRGMSALQRRIALSRQLLANAELVRSRGPDRFMAPVEMALEAWRLYPTVEADGLLRYGLDWLPVLDVQIPMPSRTTDMVFRPDRRSIATVGDDHHARVWDLFDRKETARVRYDPSATQTILSPDGRYLAVLVHGLVQLLDLTDPKVKLSVPHGGEVLVAAFSANGLFFATGGSDQVVKVWKLKGSGEPAEDISEISSLAVDKGCTVARLTFSPEGDFIIIQGDYRRDDYEDWTYKIAVWQVSPAVRFSTTAGGELASLSKGGGYLVYGDLDTVWADRLYDPKEESFTFLRDREPHVRVTALALHPEDPFLAAGYSDGAVRVYDLGNAGRLIATLEHKEEIISVAFKPTGESLISVTADQVLRVWSAVRKGSFVQMDESMRIQLSAKLDFLALSPDGRIATVDAIGGLRVWEDSPVGGAASLRYVPSWRKASLSSDARYLALQTLNRILVWDTVKARWAGKVAGGFFLAEALAISGSGRIVATGTYVDPIGMEDVPVRLWDTIGGTRIASLESSDFELLDLSPDGRLVATTTDDERRIVLWRLSSSKGIARGPSVGLSSSVRSFTFSSTSRRFAAVDGDEVLVVDTASGERIRLRHGARVLGAAFSPDDQYLAVSYMDGSVRLWNTEGRLQRVWKLGKQLGFPVWSPRGRFLALESGGIVRVLEVATGGVMTLRGEPEIHEVTFSPQEDCLATLAPSDTGSNISLWDLRRGAQSAPIEYGEQIHSLTFSPDGHYLTVVSDSAVAELLWRTRDVVDEVQSRLAGIGGLKARHPVSLPRAR